MYFRGLRFAAKENLEQLTAEDERPVHIPPPAFYKSLISVSK